MESNWVMRRKLYHTETKAIVHRSGNMDVYGMYIWNTVPASCKFSTFWVFITDGVGEICEVTLGAGYTKNHMY